MLLEEVIIYGVVFLFCGLVIWFYLRKEARQSKLTEAKIEKAV